MIIEWGKDLPSAIRTERALHLEKIDIVLQDIDLERSVSKRMLLYKNLQHLCDRRE